MIVLDHFHLVRLANQAVTRVRQRVTREHLGRRGTARDPAWANRSDISNRLFAYYQWCQRADVPEVITLAETIEAGGSVLSPPAVVDGTFFAAGLDGTLWAFTPYGAPPR